MQLIDVNNTVCVCKFINLLISYTFNFIFIFTIYFTSSFPYMCIPVYIFSFRLIPVVVVISKAFATMATMQFSTFSYSCIISPFPSFMYFLK